MFTPERDGNSCWINSILFEPIMWGKYSLQTSDLDWRVLSTTGSKFFPTFPCLIFNRSHDKISNNHNHDNRRHSTTALLGQWTTTSVVCLRLQPGCSYNADWKPSWASVVPYLSSKCVRTEDGAFFQTNKEVAYELLKLHLHNLTGWIIHCKTGAFKITCEGRR